MTSQPENSPVTNSTSSNLSAEVTEAMALVPTENSFQSYPKLPPELKDMVLEGVIRKRIIHVGPPASGSVTHTDKDGNVTHVTGLRAILELTLEGSILLGDYQSHVLHEGLAISMPQSGLLRASKATRAFALEKWPFQMRLPGLKHEVRFGPHDAIQIDNIFDLIGEMRIAPRFHAGYGSLLNNVHTLCIDVDFVNLTDGVPTSAIEVSWIDRLMRQCPNTAQLYGGIKKIILVCNETGGPLDSLDDYETGPFQVKELTLLQCKMLNVAEYVSNQVSRSIGTYYTRSSHHDPNVLEEDLRPVVEIVARNWPAAVEAVGKAHLSMEIASMGRSAQEEEELSEFKTIIHRHVRKTIQKWLTDYYAVSRLGATHNPLG